MSKNTNIAKTIASWLIALVIGFIFTSLLFISIGQTITEHFTVMVIIIILLMSLPFYVIIRKKLFK
jgi:uncharacterized membrane protein YgaE (UPF0421/DUF939 family)